MSRTDWARSNAALRLVAAAVSFVLVFGIVGADTTDAQGIGGSGAVPVSPGRLLDTRPGKQTVDGAGAGIGMRAARTTLALQVNGRAGVPANAGAVMLNVTAVGAIRAGYLTVYPCGEAQPLTSNVNFRPGAAIANSVFAKIGRSGQICIYAHSPVHVVVDVNGHALTGGPNPISPARLLDTRPGKVTTDRAVQYESTGRLRAGESLPVLVAGRTGIPAIASTVMLNVTAVDPAAAGYLTVYPCGQRRPLASSLNFKRGDVRPNAVVAKVGSFGYVCVYAHATTHIVIDANGYSLPGSPPATAPARLLDTRPGKQTVDGRAAGVGRRGAGTTLALTVAGRGGVPSHATAAMLNVTVVNPRTAGYVTVYPCGERRPLASNVNVVAGRTMPNGVFANLGTAGRVCLYTHMDADLVVDTNGYATRYRPDRWTNTEPGWWWYDGDGNGLPEDLWVYRDNDDTVDNRGFVGPDGKFDWVAVDAFGSQRFDAWLDVRRHPGHLLYVDVDGDGRFEMQLRDDQRDGYAEVVYLDADLDGQTDIGLGDAGQDGYYESVLRDLNGDGAAETWVRPAPPPSITPAPQPATIEGFYRNLAAAAWANQPYRSSACINCPTGTGPSGPSILGNGLFPDLTPAPLLP